MPWKISLSLLLALLAIPLFADADLSLVAEQPRTYIVNEEAQFVLHVMNSGPDAAHNVRVTFDVPPGIRIPAIHTDKGPCAVTGSPIVCTVGDVAAGASGPPTLIADVLLPPTPGNVTLSATIASDTPDPRPENNTAARTITVIDATDFFMDDAIAPARVDPGATAVATTVLKNFVASVPADIHIHYAATNATIEKVDAPPEWSCTVAGSTADCRAAALEPNCRCSGNIRLTLRAPADRAGGTITLTPAVTSSLPQLDDLPVFGTATATIYRWIVVTTAADSGAGSLRDAIATANGGCSAPCKIAFQIPAPVPPSGWFTITPSTPLPPITADRVFVDGTTQTAFTGDTNAAGPEVALDGRLTNAGHGLELDSNCDAEVEGLSVGNFADHGIAIFGGPCGTRDTADARRIAHNYLGVDPTGFTATPNLRGALANNVISILDNVISGNRYSGVWAWSGDVTIDNNRIGTAADGKTPLPNGNSGIFFGPAIFAGEAIGNTISFNGQMGVAVARGAHLVDIRGNSMRQNGGLGIDIGLDGPNAPVPDDRLTQPNPPALLSAVYDPSTKSTVVTLSVRTNFVETFFNVAVIDFYANDGPDGDGERPIYENQTRSTSGETFTMNLPGDWRGKWINATSSRVHFLDALPPAAQSITPSYYVGGDSTTSELSNAVPVQ